VNAYEAKLQGMIDQFKATLAAMNTEPTEQELADAEKLDDATVDRLWGEVWHHARKLNRQLKRAIAGNS
jgi:hypothetical protein